MPKQSSSTSVLAKVAGQIKKAVGQSKKNETKFDSGGSLPAGIEGGVAQVIQVKFDQDKNGQPYFRAAAVIVSPENFKGNRLKGRQTSIFEPIADTPNKTRKTILDHVDWVLNTMRTLGYDTADMGDEDLESAAAAIQEAKPYITFRTWASTPTKQYPDPMTNEVWIKAIDDYIEETASVESVVDDAPVDTGEEAAVESAPWDGDDLDETATAADADNAEAQQKLQDLAISKGITMEQLAELPNWTAIAEAIKEADGGISDTDWDALGAEADGDGAGADAAVEKLTEAADAAGLNPDDYPENWTSLAEALKAELGGGEAAAEEFIPLKGYVYMYKPKTAKKATEHEVIAVFPDKKTVTVKDSTDPKKRHMGVAWSELGQG